MSAERSLLTTWRSFLVGSDPLALEVLNDAAGTPRQIIAPTSEEEKGTKIFRPAFLGIPAQELAWTTDNASITLLGDGNIQFTPTNSVYNEVSVGFKLYLKSDPNMFVTFYYYGIR